MKIFKKSVKKIKSIMGQNINKDIKRPYQNVNINEDIVVQNIHINSEYEYDLSYKFIILGNSNIGKSQIHSRIISKTFDIDLCNPTLCLDFGYTFRKVNDKVIKINFWDTSGNIKFKNLCYPYIKGSNAIILTFDLTNRQSFDDIYLILKDINNVNIPIFLFGNKCDCKHISQVGIEDINKLCEREGLTYYEVSAKNNINIDYSFHQIIKFIYLIN